MKNMYKAVFLSFILLLFLQGILLAQDPARFNNEVNELISKDHHFNNSKPVLLFAGSSSIRKWNNIEDSFSGYNVIKNGFGGSQFSDLIFFYDKLIAPYKPDVILIYEGDNDIADGKKPSEILKDAKHLLSMIRNDFPETPVIFISAKPSISRWGLKKEYEVVNKKLSKLCSKKENTGFADVWSIMLDSNGNVRNDLFVSDNLHMNHVGYELWTKEITKVLNDVLK